MHSTISAFLLIVVNEKKLTSDALNYFYTPFGNNFERGLHNGVKLYVLTHFTQTLHNPMPLYPTYQLPVDTKNFYNMLTNLLESITGSNDICSVAAEYQDCFNWTILTGKLNLENTDSLIETPTLFDSISCVFKRLRLVMIIPDRQIILWQNTELRLCCEAWRVLNTHNFGNWSIVNKWHFQDGKGECIDYGKELFLFWIQLNYFNLFSNYKHQDYHISKQNKIKVLPLLLSNTTIVPCYQNILNDMKSIFYLLVTPKKIELEHNLFYNQTYRCFKIFINIVKQSNEMNLKHLTVIPFSFFNKIIFLLWSRLFHFLQSSDSMVLFNSWYLNRFLLSGRTFIKLTQKTICYFTEIILSNVCFRSTSNCFNAVSLKSLCMSIMDALPQLMPVKNIIQLLLHLEQRAHDITRKNSNSLILSGKNIRIKLLLQFRYAILVSANYITQKWNVFLPKKAVYRISRKNWSIVKKQLKLLIEISITLFTDELVELIRLCVALQHELIFLAEIYVCKNQATILHLKKYGIWCLSQHKHHFFILLITKYQPQYARIAEEHLRVFCSYASSRFFSYITLAMNIPSAVIAFIGLWSSYFIVNNDDVLLPISNTTSALDSSVSLNETLRTPRQRRVPLLNLSGLAPPLGGYGVVAPGESPATTAASHRRVCKTSPNLKNGSVKNALYSKKMKPTSSLHSMNGSNSSTYNSPQSESYRGSYNNYSCQSGILNCTNPSPLSYPNFDNRKLLVGTHQLPEETIPCFATAVAFLTGIAVMHGGSSIPTIINGINYKRNFVHCNFPESHKLQTLWNHSSFQNLWHSAKAFMHNSPTKLALFISQFLCRCPSILASFAEHLLSFWFSIKAKQFLRLLTPTLCTSITSTNPVFLQRLGVGAFSSVWEIIYKENPAAVKTLAVPITPDLDIWHIGFEAQKHVSMLESCGKFLLDHDIQNLLPPDNTDEHYINGTDDDAHSQIEWCRIFSSVWIEVTCLTVLQNATGVPQSTVRLFDIGVIESNSNGECPLNNWNKSYTFKPDKTDDIDKHYKTDVYSTTYTREHNDFIRSERLCFESIYHDPSVILNGNLPSLLVPPSCINSHHNDISDNLSVTNSLTYWVITEQYDSNFLDWRRHEINTILKPELHNSYDIIQSCKELCKKREGATFLLQCFKIYQRVIEAVEAVHRCHIAHNDIKGHNILIKKNIDGYISVALTDFGEADYHFIANENGLCFNSDVTQSDCHTFNQIEWNEWVWRNQAWCRGTELIKSPELLKLSSTSYNYTVTHNTQCNDLNDSPIGLAGDVWAVGCFLYELLTGLFLYSSEINFISSQLSWNYSTVLSDNQWTNKHEFIQGSNSYVNKYQEKSQKENNNNSIELHNNEDFWWCLFYLRLHGRAELLPGHAFNYLENMIYRLLTNENQINVKETSHHIVSLVMDILHYCLVLDYTKRPTISQVKLFVQHIFETKLFSLLIPSSNNNNIFP